MQIGIHAPVAKGLLALATVGLFAAPSAYADQVAGSSAFAVSARLTSGGSVTGLPPVAKASGTIVHPYDVTATVDTLSRLIGIADGNLQIATLSVNGSALRGHAESSGIGVDSLSVEGDASVGALTMTLVQYPPPPAGGGPVLPLPLLSLSTTAVSASAYDTVVFPQTPQVAATASFGSLTVTGQLLGGQTLMFPGSAKPNTVLFSNGTVTITLNRNLISGLISCQPTCVFSPTGIAADAIAVELHNAKIGGNRVSGELLVGGTEATIP